MSKKKKEKVVYYDDNSTIADMSSVNKKGQKQPPPPPKSVRSPSTFKEKWQTYWSAVKMMLAPTLVVLAIILILYLCVILLGQCAGA